MNLSGILDLERLTSRVTLGVGDTAGPAGAARVA